MSSKYGPNVTKLIIKIMSYEAIPPGGGIADGIEFIRNPERRAHVLEVSEAKAVEALALVKTAPDNPFGDDDEAIAKELLRQFALRHADDDGER